MAKIEMSLGPAHKAGLPVAEVMCRRTVRGHVYFDDFGLKMAGFYKEGLWPLRSQVTALACVCMPESKDLNGQPDEAMRFCHLPAQAREAVLEAIKGLYPVCPVKEQCGIPGCWAAVLKEGG